MARPVSAPEQRQIDAIWSQYGDLTRFLHSSRIAAERETEIWNSVLSQTDPTAMQINATPTGSAVTYTISVENHLAALASTETLAGLVLVRSWSLGESLGRIALGLSPDASLPRVEEWAPDALALNYQGVGRVFGGLAGLVESFVVRNAVTHAALTWSARMIRRVSDVGGSHHWRGERIDLSDDALERYRGSVRSLMRLLGLRASR